MSKHSGQLELTWTDKDKTLLSTGDGKYDYMFVDPSDYRVSEVRLLHEVDVIASKDGRPEGSDLPEPTDDNLLITGDSMHALDALAKHPDLAAKYLGKVKLVYIDPPFNTGQTFDHYEDSIEHSIWLTMLRDRLKQIYPLLSSDGSVWVHLDHVESHRCRVVLDEQFGPENFVGEVVWQKADSLRADTKGLSVSHDVILAYRKSKAFKPNTGARTADMNTRFSSKDGDPELWFDDNPTAPGAATHQGMVYGIQQPITGEVIYPTRGRHWPREQESILAIMQQWAPYELRDIDDAVQRAAACNLSPDEVRKGVKAVMLAVPVEEARTVAKARYDEGNWPDIVIRSGGTGGFGWKSRVPAKGRVPETWWPNSEVGHNRQAKSEIKALFPGEHPFATPKPERLLQRVIQIASAPGDIVLDCFAGSGTTAAVAHKMGRRWVTSELLSSTLETYTKPRLTLVVEGNDPGGVTTVTERVADNDVELPDMTPDEAQEFNRLLGKALKALSDDDADPALARALKKATKTREVATKTWFGGGGFRHLEVGPSMFETVEGFVCLADWATKGDLAKAMCAQLEVPYEPDGIFVAKKGRVRYVVLDGLVGDTTIESILDQLGDKQIVEVWATQYVDTASDVLRKARPGSRLEAIPDSVLDRYRRKAAKGSPFKKKEQVDE